MSEKSVIADEANDVYIKRRLGPERKYKSGKVSESKSRQTLSLIRDSDVAPHFAFAVTFITMTATSEQSRVEMEPLTEGS